MLASAFFKRETDEAKIKTALNETIPPLFDYLERELADSDWLVGNRFSQADISTGAEFVDLARGGGEVDAGRWPKLTAYVERVRARPSFKATIEEEKAILKSVVG